MFNLKNICIFAIFLVIGINVYDHIQYAKREKSLDQKANDKACTINVPLPRHWAVGMDDNPHNTYWEVSVSEEYCGDVSITTWSKPFLESDICYYVGNAYINGKPGYYGGIIAFDKVEEGTTRLAVNVYSNYREPKYPWSIQTIRCERIVESDSSVDFILDNLND